MFALLVVSFAAAAPEGVDLDDLDHWESRSSVLLDGPQGCWMLSGDVAVHFAAYTPPSLWSRAERHDYKLTGDFEGRFSEGAWTRFEYTLKPDGERSGTELDVPLFPMMGEIDQKVVKRRGEVVEGGSSVSVDAGGEAMNLVKDVIDEIDPSTTISYAQWHEDDAGVVLFQDMPITDKNNSDSLTVTTFFPDGAPHGTRLDVDFPRRIKVGDGLIRPTVFDAQMHLRGQVDDAHVLPALESVSLGLGVLGFTVGYEQKLTYTKAVTCSGGEPASVPPASEPPSPRPRSPRPPISRR